MTVFGTYFDLNVSAATTQAVIRDNGNEIAFDFNGQDGTLYTVQVKRATGTLFKGKATSQPGGAVAEVTCRVYEDRNEGITVLVGSHWKYTADPKNYRWLVELQSN